MIKRCLTSLVATLIVCFLACSSASARVCFLPDSTDCGSSDVNIPDVPCKYYSCKEAGGESNAYQTCYPERTYNNGGVNVTCWQVKCNISKSDCEAQAKATSQSCKFDDASGCYYLGECKQCNKDLYDLKEPKSGSDWECDSCTGCDGTFYSCTAKKECKDINPDYTSKCADTQTAEEVKGVKDSNNNQCYTCKSKPIDKCVDIEATPFLDIIEPTVTTVKASGEVKEVNATLECGINPKKAYKYEINIINNYDYIKLPVNRIKPVEYRYYASGSLPGYYYKTNIDGKNVCITDRLCTQYAKDGEYISAYEISIKDMSVKLDYKIYCCKTDDNFSGDSLSHLYSSCKEAQTVFESQHIDRYIEPFYVCDKGIKEGTKCKIGSYSCPKDYELSGDNCVKKECPKGYVLTSDNGKDVCVNPTYTCPTDGKYKYKLSGNQCVCDTSKTCHDINPDYYSMSDTEKYNECKRLDEYYNDSDIFVMETTDVIGSDGKCFYCHHRTCAEIAEYVEAGEKYYTSCKNTEIAEEASYLPGSDGQCYTCRAKTCRDYAKEFNKTYVMEDDDAACEKATGRHADVFDVIEREFAADGQCYECKLLKCNEISDIYGTKDMQCPAGYRLEEEDNYIAEDGQCYYCRKSKVYVVFDYELQGNSDAGQYNTCVYGSDGLKYLDFTNQMYYCSRLNYGEDYNVGDYYNPDPKKYYETCHHVSDWNAYLKVDDSEVTGFNSKTWTLPFDMEMVVTYDIPYIMYDSCLSGQAPIIRFAPKGAIQTYPEIFAPRTVRMKFPKGSKVDAVMRKQPVDYLDGITTDHFTIEYYVNGQKISGRSITIDDVSYSFNGTWN